MPISFVRQVFLEHDLGPGPDELAGPPGDAGSRHVQCFACPDPGGSFQWRFLHLIERSDHLGGPAETGGMVSAPSKTRETAYLFLQWPGSSRLYSRMAANPVGCFVPLGQNDFADPLVHETCHGYHMDVVRETVARPVPTIACNKATTFKTALDEKLMPAPTKAGSTEQAMADTAAEWKISLPAPDATRSSRSCAATWRPGRPCSIQSEALRRKAGHFSQPHPDTP